MDCKICHQPSQPIFDATVLRKHRVEYFACPSCGFVQTEEPFWLSEAYGTPISAADVGLVGRNFAYSRVLRKFIPLVFPSAETFLDYGGGNGMLVRLMRDEGFDYRWADKFATNQFAQGFEHQPGTHYPLLTAFEVFEHLPDPKQEVAEMAALADTIIFSTELVTTPPPRLNEWFYFGPTHGQHIAFYTRKALQLLGAEHGFQYFRVGGSLHMFSKIPRNSLWMRIAAFSRLSDICRMWNRRSSLLDQDAAAAIARMEGRTFQSE